MHTEDIGETLSSAHSDEKALSRKCLLKILSNVRLLARQALPLRGSKDGEQSNFQLLYYLRGEDNPFLRDWLTRKGDRYIHGEIQNEMMKMYISTLIGDQLSIRMHNTKPDIIYTIISLQLFPLDNRCVGINTLGISRNDAHPQLFIALY